MTTTEERFVWMLTDPRNPALVGKIERRSNGDVSLTYGDDWLDTGFPLSADLPLSPNEYAPIHRRARQPAAPGALDDARPDNWGEKVIRYLHQPRSNHLFEYLYFAGDERFGALGISSSDQTYTPCPTSPLPRLEDAQSISDAARIIGAGGKLDGQRRLLVYAGASLGGAKPKAVVSIKQDQYVLKLFNAEPVDQPLVEHATMTLAAKAGINVAKTLLVPLEAEHALAIKRFDRVRDRRSVGTNAGTNVGKGAGKDASTGAGATTRRLHCISAATVLRAETPAGETPRYGYPHLARALRRFADQKMVGAQLQELFRRMVFNILIANTDDHEKNHSFIVRANGVLELSPAYDIVPTGSGATEHEFLIGENSSEASLREAMSVCSQFGLTPGNAAQAVVKIIRTVSAWNTHFRACGVTRRDIAELESVIDRDDLVQQRMRFDPADYRSTKARTAVKTRNPFR